MSRGVLVAIAGTDTLLVRAGTVEGLEPDYHLIRQENKLCIRKSRVVLTASFPDPVPAVAQAVSRQLQALDRCLVLKSQADANPGRPVVAVTELAVKVAQNAAASELDAVNAEAHA